MSTISISTGYQASRRPVHTALRLTRRGQVVVMATFLLVALAVMIVFGGLAVASRDHGTPPPVKLVQVQPGDTLYGIAGQVAGPGEVREVVHQIKELNSLDNGVLQVGDEIAVPLG